MKKTISMLAMSAILAISLSVQDAAADKRNRDRNAAIGAAIALGIIGAVAAHEQDRRGYRQYRPRRDMRIDENAVGACMLRTKRVVRQAGGYRAKLNVVRSVFAKKNRRTVVVFDATGFYDYGRKRSRVRCVVRNHRVVNFTFN